MGKKKASLILVVRGDYNDADFVTKATPITQKELNKFLPLIEAIHDFQPYKGTTDSKWGAPNEYLHDHNWPRGEYGCRTDLGEKTVTKLYGNLAEEFDELYVPNGGEQAGYSLHTIHEIYVVRFERKLLDAGKGWGSI